jgi:hypothetical protein
VNAAIIVISSHAVETAEERAGLTPADVREEVIEAVRAGRVSARRPAFLEPGRPASRGRVFIWTERGQRAYLVHPKRGGVVTVVTLIATVDGDFSHQQGPTSVQQAFRRARRRAAA